MWVRFFGIKFKVFKASKNVKFTCKKLIYYLFKRKYCLHIFWKLVFTKSNFISEKEPARGSSSICLLWLKINEDSLQISTLLLPVIKLSCNIDTSKKNVITVW